MWGKMASSSSMASSSTNHIEEDSVLTGIFHDEFPDKWRSNTDFVPYLSELSSFGLDSLSREPDKLSAEREQIMQQTCELAFHNYKTFIQTAECSRDILGDFNDVEEHLNKLLVKLPDFDDKCEQFIKKSSEINNSRRVTSLTLAKHTQLLELLEMPQLMDTCVRNGYFDEALELASHVRRMQKKYSHIPIIMNIVEDVKRTCQLMLQQLTGQLRSNIQLPQCLKAIGYLRRMDVFSEAELRIKFLQARDVWFQGQLNSIPTDDPYFHMTKTLEVSRVSLFDVVTQYRAIFSDDDPLLSTNPNALPNESAIFHGWINHKISEFLRTLEADLKAGVGSRLDSLLGQCMYFGLSFSRVGADFRSLLTPLFQDAIIQAFTDGVQDATDRFCESMATFSFTDSPAWVSSMPADLVDAQVLTPPQSLLKCQSLAQYGNDMTACFMELQSCAPLSTAHQVATVVNRSINEVINNILDFYRAEESSLSGEERWSFQQLCVVVVNDLLPFLNRCLHALFPPEEIAACLGITKELCAKNGIGSLNVKVIGEPLERFQPIDADFALPTSTPITAAQPTAAAAQPTAAASQPTAAQTTTLQQPQTIAEQDEGDGATVVPGDSVPPAAENGFRRDVENLPKVVEEEEGNIKSEPENEEAAVKFSLPS